MLWRTVFVLLSLMIGLRYEVGGDWFAYLDKLDIASTQTLTEALMRGDSAYVLLNWLGSGGWWGTYFVNTVCGVLFSWGLVAFCNVQTRPWLALVVAVPYLVLVVAMGYTRQGVAIGLAMLGLVALQKEKVWRFVFWIGVAATFHKSAVILVPLAIFSTKKFRSLVIPGMLFSTVLFYALFLKESMDALILNYIGTDYSSSGAVIRVGMNALPAAIFLCFKHRFIFMMPEQRNFWSWVSILALGFVVLLWVSPSSTAVDRLALYCIPLQIMVWSHLPDIAGRPRQRNTDWVFVVIAYSAAVMFSWLLFAGHAQSWLPYKFYPWEALWQ